jgi:DNA-binding Lrp family transcriptional regulator
MSFTPIAPRVAPSRRGGVAFRLARPARGDVQHVEARFFIERPLALEAGIKPGDPASVSIGEGEDAGWLRLAADKAGGFRFGRSGGKHGGGCVVSIGYTEIFGREPGYHRVGREEIKASPGALLVPIPVALRYAAPTLAAELADRRQVLNPGCPTAGTDEGGGDAAPRVAAPSSNGSAPPERVQGAASPEVKPPPAGGAVTAVEDGHVEPQPKNSQPQAATPATPKADDLAARILAALAGGPMAPGPLAEEVGCSRTWLRKILADLIARGLVIGSGATKDRRMALAEHIQAAISKAAPVKVAVALAPVAAPASAPAAAPADEQPHDARIRQLVAEGCSIAEIAVALQWGTRKVSLRLDDLKLRTAA